MEKQVVKHEEHTPATSAQAVQVQRDATPETDTIFLPDVDVVEQPDCFRLVADMPGVDQNSVSVTVENDVLTIEGRPRVEAPQGYELVGQEYEVGRYRRDFTLSDAVDVDGIKAKVVRGVLEVTLPKHERLKKRMVTIET